ncbi:MAG: hypothetical protein CCU27_07970 [Nitrospira sp. UW-LDO-02]|jgi:hypothetical protein|nr:MAG: hypothetical protein CCU27_07970 [Nitrospira sp. UW-LDO-02]HAN91214.1 hypothetical protein [Nitrospira sp.]
MSIEHARMQSALRLLRPGSSAFRQENMSPRADRFSSSLKDADILSSTVPEKNEASMKGG